MKKLLVLMTAVALFQHWDNIERLLGSEPPLVKGDVVLYATSWCGYCQKTRELLAEQGIGYTEFDVETSAAGREQYEALGGRGVPVLTVGDTVIHGYDRGRIIGALD